MIVNVEHVKILTIIASYNAITPVKHVILTELVKHVIKIKN